MNLQGLRERPDVRAAAKRYDETGGMRRITASFDELLCLFADPANQFKEIAKTHHVSRQAIQQCYWEHFASFLERVRKHAWRKRKRDRERRKQRRPYADPTLEFVARRANKAGLKVKYLGSNLLRIGTLRCKVHAPTHLFFPNRNKVAFLPTSVCKTSLQKTDVTIFVRNVEGREKCLYIYLNGEILDAFQWGHNERSIYVPAGGLRCRSAHAQDTVLPWPKRKNAWHQLFPADDAQKKIAA